MRSHLSWCRLFLLGRKLKPLFAGQVRYFRTLNTRLNLLNCCNFSLLSNIFACIWGKIFLNNFLISSKSLMNTVEGELRGWGNLRNLFFFNWVIWIGQGNLIRLTFQTITLISCILFRTRILINYTCYFNKGLILLTK